MFYMLGCVSGIACLWESAQSFSSMPRYLYGVYVAMGGTQSVHGNELVPSFTISTLPVYRLVRYQPKPSVLVSKLHWVSESPKRMNFGSSILEPARPILATDELVCSVAVLVENQGLHSSTSKALGTVSDCNSRLGPLEGMAERCKNPLRYCEVYYETRHPSLARLARLRRCSSKCASVQIYGALITSSLRAA